MPQSPVWGAGSCPVARWSQGCGGRVPSHSVPAGQGTGQACGARSAELGPPQRPCARGGPPTAGSRAALGCPPHAEDSRGKANVSPLSPSTRDTDSRGDGQSGRWPSELAPPGGAGHTSKKHFQVSDLLSASGAWTKGNGVSFRPGSLEPTCLFLSLPLTRHVGHERPLTCTHTGPAITGVTFPACGSGCDVGLCPPPCSASWARPGPGRCTCQKHRGHSGQGQGWWLLVSQRPHTPGTAGPPAATHHSAAATCPAMTVP